MSLPFGMRPSSLEERKEFYSGFDLRKSRDWAGRKLVYAVIIGRHSGIYPREYEEDRNISLAIDDYASLKQVVKTILRFLPEGVYYDRNYYRDFSLCHGHDLTKAWGWENFEGQELAFDIDPENVTCPVHGTLQERMKKGTGLGFCGKAFEIARSNALRVYESVKQAYSDVRIVFSGRGFHVHVFDEDARKLSRADRKEIAREYDFGIDRWVTNGEMRLIRLPYTLNGISSRIVLPLKKSGLEKFDPEKDALPAFLKH